MTAWLTGNLVLASLMLLVVLVLRRPAAAWLGAGAAYALWLAPALRLVWPPLPSGAGDSLLPPLVLEIGAAGAAALPPPQGGPGQWVPVLLALWAGGAAVFTVWQWRVYRAFLARISAGARTIGTHSGLPVVASAGAEGPIAVGLLDRRIVVPEDFGTRYTADERRLALAHEAVHHRRGDIWWNLFALGFLALNWFNPFAWIAFRAFRADQELACDAAVAAAASPSERHAYGSALVKSASRPGLVSACPLNHADQLKRRLKMMTRHRGGALRTATAFAAAALVAGAGAMLGTPGIAHPHPDGEGAEKRRIVILEGADGEKHGALREFHIGRGEDGALELPRGCTEGEEVAKVDETTDGRRTRIVLCERGEADTASRLERLQKTRERIAGNEELSGAHRDRVLAALDREIARLRGR